MGFLNCGLDFPFRPELRDRLAGLRGYPGELDRLPDHFGEPSPESGINPFSERAEISRLFRFRRFDRS